MNANIVIKGLAVVVVAVLFVVINFVVDVLYTMIDPRVKALIGRRG